MGRKIRMSTGTIEEPGLITTRIFDLDYEEEISELMWFIRDQILDYDDISFFIKTIEMTEQ